MKNLISLEQSLDDLEQELLSNPYEFETLKNLNKMFKRKKTLKQPPQLNHFVPAVLKDWDWRVLTEPRNYGAFQAGMSSKDFNFEVDECVEFQTALKDVLFDGWEVVEIPFIHGTKHYYLEYNGLRLFKNINGFWERNHTISIQFYSDLTKYNLPLNEKGCENFNL